MASIQETLLADFTSEAERSFTVGDTFDMKANVLLVVITFLAGQTAYFLTIATMPIERLTQLLSAVVIIVAGILTLIELRPQDYIFFSPSNGAIEKKIEKLRQEHHGKEERVILEHLMTSEIEWARERSAKHKKLNNYKSKILLWTFRFMAISVILNLFTLICVAIHPSSAAH